MKKIMFDDRFALTKSVLEGRKTMTRRIIKDVPNNKYYTSKLGRVDNGEECFLLFEGGKFAMDVYPKYKVGEIVAVAQSYKSIHEEMMNGDYGNSMYDAFRGVLVTSKAGWNNKMFVRTKLMPHLIRITDVDVQRLQDISDEDCLREGMICEFNDPLTRGWGWDIKSLPFDETYRTPKEAFAALIDKVRGKGTWERNPWVFAYSFELVR